MTARHFLQRLLQMGAALLAMSFLMYMLIGLMPGDPVDLMLAGDPPLTAADALRLKAMYGLDKPLLSRWAHWLLQTLQGRAGFSRLYDMPVMQVLWPRLAHTALLMGLALLLTLCIAVPLGVSAARRPGSPGDKIINIFCLSGLSLPAFWLALLLIDFFVVRHGWLPAGASARHPLSMILPVVTLAAGGIAVYIRHLRASMIAALSADYIKTAAAKGCSPARIVWGHALRNALAPVVTVLMIDLGALVGGTVVIEEIFAYPGMGKLMFDAITGNDYNLALAGFLLLTACVMAANLLADILYARLDPRVGRDA